MAAKRKILCIDDTPAVLHLLGQAFIKAGYQVTTASDGKSGLDMALTTAPDVIVSDVVMPEMTGYELCRTLKNNPATRSIPIILLTARGDAASTVKGFEAGADEYIPKPFNMHEVLARVERILRWVAPPAGQAAQINGTLEKTPLFDLLRFCEEHRISGTIQLTRTLAQGATETSQIHLERGEITAIALRDLADIAEALDQLLEWHNGVFVVQQEALQFPGVDAEPTDEPVNAPAEQTAESAASQRQAAFQTILQELQAQSEDLHYAVLLDSQGQLLNAVTSKPGQALDILRATIAQAVAFSARLSQEFELGAPTEILMSSAAKILVFYPLEQVGALGVGTVKEQQGMLRWNCREAILKIQDARNT